MFASPLWRNVGDGSFEDLKERLLHAFSGNVSGDGNVFRFSCDLIDLIHINYALLSFFHIPVRRLDKSQKNVFNVFAHIACLCK